MASHLKLMKPLSKINQAVKSRVRKIKRKAANLREQAFNRIDSQTARSNITIIDIPAGSRRRLSFSKSRFEEPAPSFDQRFAGGTTKGTIRQTDINLGMPRKKPLGFRLTRYKSETSRPDEQIKEKSRSVKVERLRFKPGKTYPEQTKEIFFRSNHKLKPVGKKRGEEYKK